jgi:hypothetical protein
MQEEENEMSNEQSREREKYKKLIGNSFFISFVCSNFKIEKKNLVRCE